MGSSQLGRVAQIGIVVADIESARRAWAGLLGVEEPPIIETESRESTHMLFRGTPSEGRARLCFFKLDNIALELIRPVGGPSTWQSLLEESGQGVHHLAFNVEDLEGTLARFEEGGMGVEQKGEYKGGCYTYIDSRRELGPIIELLHAHR